MTAPEPLVPVPSRGGGTGTDRPLRFPEPAGTDRNLRPSFIPLADFLVRAEQEPPRDWLIPGIIPDRGRVLIVAPTNAGKTWVALVAAIAASKADRTVLFIEEEGSRRGLAERMKALGLTEAPRFEVAHLEGWLLDDRTHRAMLRERLEQETAPVMVLDPLVSLWRGDENSTKDANPVRAHLEELAKVNARALLIVLHHTGKAGARGEGDETFAGRGSSVFPGWADLQLNLTPVAMERGSGLFAVDASVSKDREGERGLKMRVQVNLVTHEVTLDEAPRGGGEDLRRLVLDAVRQSLDGLNKTGIAKVVRRNRQKVLQTIDALVEDGSLSLEGNLYRLAPQGDE